MERRMFKNLKIARLSIKEELQGIFRVEWRAEISKPWTLKMRSDDDKTLVWNRLHSKGDWYLDQ